MNLSLNNKIIMGFIALGMVIVLLYALANFTKPRPALADETVVTPASATQAIAGEA